MIPELKHLSPQQSTEGKLHRKALPEKCGQQGLMERWSIFEIKALQWEEKCYP